MTTTLKELGEMLIAVDGGRILQVQAEGNVNWQDYYIAVGLQTFRFDLNCKYRLKPEVTYYTVYKNAKGTLCVQSSNHQPCDEDEWISGYTHIHDFEIEA